MINITTMKISKYEILKSQWMEDIMEVGIPLDNGVKRMTVQQPSYGN